MLQEGGGLSSPVQGTHNVLKKLSIGWSTIVARDTEKETEREKQGIPHPRDGKRHCTPKEKI